MSYHYIKEYQQLVWFTIFQLKWQMESEGKYARGLITLLVALTKEKYLWPAQITTIADTDNEISSPTDLIL